MGEAPEIVGEDASIIREKTTPHSVIVEDAVDDEWYIKAEGPTDGLSEEKFDSMVEIIRDEISGSHDTIKIFYGVGAETSKYLVRLEYV